MKTKFLLLALVLFSVLSFGQSVNFNRSVVESSLDVVFENTGAVYKFNSTLENSLNLEVVMTVDLVENNKYLCESNSFNIVKSMLTLISNYEVSNKIAYDCNYKYLLFKVSFVSHNGENCANYYKVEIDYFKSFIGNNNQEYLNAIIKDWE